MDNILKILVVEDTPTDAELISFEIRRINIEFKERTVCTENDFLTSLADFKPDIIISDYTLPQFTGMEALSIRNEKHPLIPFILVTGTLNEEIAVECMKAGADDYILKSNLSRLAPAVNNAIKKIRLLQAKDIAEKALHESNERYRQLIEQSPDAIAVHSDGRLVFVNPAAVRLFGALKPEQLLGMPVLNLVHDSFKQKVIERVKDVMNGINAPAIEEKLVKFDGTVIDVEVLGIPYNYNGKNASQIIVRDITERKKAEEALKKSEEKFRTIFENVQDVYYETTFDGLILEVSPAIERFSHGQYSREDVVGRNISEFYISPEERDQFLNSILDKGYVIDNEIRLKNRDGSQIYASISSRIIQDENGTAQKIIGSMRNVSVRKQSEETVERERRLLRTVIDNIPDLIYVKDKQGRKLRANIADVRHSGYDSEEIVIGKTDLELYPGETGKAWYKDDMEVISTGQGIIEKEEHYLNKNGVEKWLLTTKVPLYDKEGNVTGLVGLGHDISRRKKTEEDLIRAMIKAEESDRLKTAFIHNISHEIRTPMNAIVGFSSLLTDPELDDTTRKYFIDTIAQSSNHLLSIISNIVEISNIEASLVAIDKKPVNLYQLLTAVCDQYSAEAEKKNIALNFEHDVSEDVVILTDPSKLKQIVSNLISNSVKFTSSGRVVLRQYLRDNWIYFCVSDTGIGIPEEHQPRIFDRFYQVQNHFAKEFNGTGLGLAISKSYIELLGGRIWLISSPGIGSSFYFTIPYEPVIQLMSPNPIMKEHPIFSEKKTILVAEDTDSNFELINFLLLESNVTVIRVNNGLEAYKYFKHGDKADMILMDLKMPVMDGFTATRKIRELDSNIPIIAQTAYADDSDKAIKAGCTAFITKPLDKKEFYRVIREVIK